ncbi:pheromone-processing carboxypeptidase KEX1-like, partial [Aphis craccivora]
MWFETHKTCAEKFELKTIKPFNHNSESKVTTRTPFEMLHGYRPRFHQGVLREMSKTADNWEPPEEIREAVREQLEKKKGKEKARYDRHRHDNTHYTNGEVVVMKRVPTVTGESTKLQDCYRGPLVVIEVLPGDVYRVAELDQTKNSRFA